MVGFEQLATRYFPDIEAINIWIKLARYWTQKNDVILTYNESCELFYSYLLYSLTENGFTLVIEEEKNLPLLRTKFENLNEFVFLSTEDSAENQKKAIAGIENHSAKVVVVSVQRFFQKGNKFLEYLKSYQVLQIVIHNVHKISHWGSHDEIYSGLARLKSYLRHVPIIAVSPIFTSVSEKDIKTTLHLHEPILLFLNTLPENYTYSVLFIQNDYTMFQALQDIARKYTSERGMVITHEMHFSLPNNLSFDFQSENTTFAIYTEPPDNLEQVYFLQKQYDIDNIYVIYDERLIEHKKATLKSNFKQKLHQDIAIKRFEEVIQWCTINSCKKQELQKYWQMPMTEPCGKCNICVFLQEKIPSTQNYAHDIQKLKEMLLAKRLDLAKNQNILVNQVFSDITIEEIAIYLPQNKDDLTYIAGLGTKKIQLYGDVILDMVLDFCTLYEVSDNMKNLKEQRRTKNSFKNTPIRVSVVKKAKIKTAIQEVGIWNVQLIHDFLNTEDISLSEIENVINDIKL